MRRVKLCNVLPRLEHDPEKWIPVFRKRSCSNEKIERNDDSKKSHDAPDLNRFDFLSLEDTELP
jgi:hypothetical protein